MTWTNAINRRLRDTFGVEVRRVPAAKRKGSGAGRTAAAGREQLWPGRGGAPDFIIIGAQKAGTTSLYHYLRQHPLLVPSRKKELHFFDGGTNPRKDSYARGLEWYRAQFAPEEQLTARHRTFEASPLYLFSPPAPERMAESIPGVKLIALLRDPVDRAISHYLMTERRGGETLPLMEALQAEEERLAPALATGNFKHPSYSLHSYKSRGHYLEQIQRYLEHVPRESLLIMSSTDLFDAPDDALRRVFEFVGVHPRRPTESLRPRNVARNRVEIGEDVREYLRDYFREHNEKLYDFMKHDYGWAK